MVKLAKYKIIMITRIKLFCKIDVYDVVGREGGDIAKNYNSKILAEKIGGDAVYIGTKENINKYFPEQDTVVVIMGAGNIYNISVEIKAKHLGTCID